MTRFAPKPGMVWCGKTRSWIDRPAYMPPAQPLATADEQTGTKRRSSAPARRVTALGGAHRTVYFWKADPVLPTHQIDIGVAGLGAYRKYRSHPGRHFPMVALTVNDSKDKDDVRLVGGLADEL
jgi:hypothetical protein